MNRTYIQLENKNVFNDRYVFAVYHLTIRGGIDLLDVAAELAATISDGLISSYIPVYAGGSQLSAVVFRIERDQNLVFLAIPLELFEKGSTQSLITTLQGRIFSIESLTGCRLIDLWFPQPFLQMYSGPSYTIDDLRRDLRVEDRPFICTSIYPRFSVSGSNYADKCYEFWRGGGDIIYQDSFFKSDAEAYSVFVQKISAALHQAQNETGEKKVHLFNISAGSIELMYEKVDIVRKSMDLGSYGFVVNETVGWMSAQSIIQRCPDVFIYFDGWGKEVFTRQENAFGMSLPVYTKIVRLAGGSGATLELPDFFTHNGDHVRAAKLALRLTANGYFFEQTWGLLQSLEKELQQEVKFSQKMNDIKFRDIVMHYKTILHKQSALESTSTGSFFAQNWHGIKKTSPVVFGSFHPSLFHQTMDILREHNVIIHGNGSIWGHPHGLRSGASAVRKACEAWMSGEGVFSLAERDEAVKAALEMVNAHSSAEMKYFSR